MPATITTKQSGQVSQAPLDHIELSEASVVTLRLSPRNVAAITRDGHDLVVETKDGKKIRIRNFYPEDGVENKLVLEDDDGRLWLYEGDGTEFDFAEITDVDQLAGDDGLAGALLALAGLGGLATIGAGG